jgi:sugar O-acyltransferase (sialic acid O-acetyltransferase NeuD family)
MTKKLILIGAGGHGKSCVGVIESRKDFQIQGFIDTKLAKGEQVLGYPVLGDNELLKELIKKEDLLFFITVGHIRSSEARVRIFKLLQELKAAISPAIVAESAFVSPHAKLGAGSIVMHHGIVSAGAKIGDNVIINNLSLVEHDCVISNHTHVSTGAIVNGDCFVGERVFIGSGAVLVQGISITNDVLVGAGAVVTSSISEPGTYVGNPARKI